MSKIYDKLKAIEGTTIDDASLEEIDILTDDEEVKEKKSTFSRSFIFVVVFLISSLIGILLAKYFTDFSKMTTQIIKPTMHTKSDTLEKIESPTKRSQDKKEKLILDSQKSAKLNPYLYKGGEKFIKNLEKKIYDNSDNPVNANNLSVAYTEIGRYREALRYAEKALILDPSNAFYWNNLGVVLTYLNLYSDAEKCFKKAIEISGDVGAFFYNLGNLYERMGNIELSNQNYLSYLLKSDKINPENVKLIKKITKGLNESLKK